MTKSRKCYSTIRSSLEEGFVPGGGSFYLYLQNELSNWSYLNLVGEEIFSSQIFILAMCPDNLAILVLKILFSNSVSLENTNIMKVYNVR